MLDNKVALVTGASRGIGKAIVEVFAKNGAIVYANARKEGDLDDIISENIIPLYFDVTDNSGIKNAFSQIKKEQGRLDILVNNAGIMKDALIGMISGEVMREIFETNVFAVAELIQFASKFMIRQKSGSIINISSLVGVNGNKGQLVYSASKGAVISMTKTAAKELAQYNIRVNSIAPGIIDTDLHSFVGKEHMAERIAGIGMKRLGTPCDVANSCLFLASDLSEYVTGQVIGVDGSALI
ncbi:MAG: SDR family oxidoreductase [Oscillospiraceae bacterium]|nr:SDR family oxidoreductase [Oscillospiraceae bacterium]